MNAIHVIYSTVTAYFQDNLPHVRTTKNQDYSILVPFAPTHIYITLYLIVPNPRELLVDCSKKVGYLIDTNGDRRRMASDRAGLRP